ncbi:hypothetical protein N7G274_000232 [Stereocaulon virgatum]|uniref:BRCT domain-containing protein n=1 Tax=Stereocaulon virgatum TaxID=373712 RepID=A0ABR4AU37_9LECA
MLSTIGLGDCRRWISTVTCRVKELADMADTQLPLLGVIMCCTSIPPEQRSNLASTAQQMGAVHKLDLTSDVTHLVVGDTDTPKYKFVAKERPDVKCVQASWVEAVCASWMEGGETDVEALEIEHKLPTFIGLRLCVTGFEDLIYRKQLEDLITDNGGGYRGNLTKDITHLIAKEPSGAKYNYAGQWNIKIVAVEWLEQSLERGMVLDESLYSLALPASERGKNAWMRRTMSTNSLGKRSRDEELGMRISRKLRRTASARLSSQNVGLWTDIVGLESKSEEKSMSEWDEEGKGSTYHELKSRFKGKERTPHGALESGTTEGDLRTIPGLITANLSDREGIFQGKTFLLQGFDQRQTSILQEHLHSHGADIVTNFAQLPSLYGNASSNTLYHLVPHDMHDHDVPTLPLTSPTPMTVTELWVERCLYKKRYEEPNVSVTNTPFRKFPIAGSGKLSVSSTSFQGIDLLHMSKAVKLIGATYEEFFTPTVSVLVCNAVVAGHEKLLCAQSWGIPAVRATWLWDSIRKGELLPFTAYLVQPIKDSKQSLIDAETAKAHDKSARAQRDDRLAGTDKATNKSTKEYPPPEGVDNKLAKEPSAQNGPPKTKQMSPLTSPSHPNTKNSPKDHNQAPIYPDDETLRTVKDNTDNNGSSNTLNATLISAPLREITPNSSPPKPCTSPTKSISPIKTKPLHRPSLDDSSLGPAISSLLAHHQRNNSNPNPAPPTSSDQPRMGRRRRQLLGRAPSNLSSHSINVSRASSVDTMNTDGLGTPLELSNANKFEEKTNKSKIDFPTYFSANQNDDPDREEPPLQMTQLGYEDPDVAAWRERVAIKMSGGKVNEVRGKGTTPGRKAAALSDDSGRGSLGISKRTRLATGR